MIASVGWAEDVTVTKTSFDAISGGFGTDPYIRYEAKKGAASTAPAVNNKEIRVYQNGGIFSVCLTTAGERDEIKIKSVTLGSSMKTTVTYSIDEGTASDNQSISANGTITVGGLNCSSVSFTCKGTTTSSRLYVNYLSVTYEVPTPDYIITAQSNNTDYGTVSLNGSVITGAPKDGYRYADPAYTVSPANSATVAQEGNTFAVTPSANTTVTINFEAIPTYTVTLGDDNSTLTEEIGNAGVTLPTRSALNGYDFAGWSATNVSTETTTAPTIIPAGSYTPTADITLYPVYTKTVGGGGTTHETASVTISDYATANNWVSGSNSGPQYTEVVLNSDVKATTTGTGNNGKYYSDWRFYQNGNGNVIISATSCELTSVTFTYTVSNTGTLNYNSSAITSGQAVSVSGNSAVFTVGNSGAATNGQVKITAISVNYDITGAGTTYYWSAPVAAAVEIPSIVVAENPFLFSTTATITCATEGATIKYSFDNENWSDYTSALTINESKTIYAKAIKGENESEVAQVTATKNFATPSVTISGDLTLDLDGKTDVNAGTLTAAVTYNDAAIDGATVTWSSNKPEVATIDETTGVVTIKTTGSVTFTATYAGNSNYAEAMATKTVTVIDNNAPGSAGNPYTVAQAIAYINTLGSSTSANEVYVSGIISQVDEYFDKYKSITYWISDDGTTTNQMEVYSGKGLDGADFSAVADLEVGDIVTVKGKVKKYTSNDNSIPEFTSNNQLVSFTRPEKPKHTVAFYQNGEKLSETTIEEGTAIEFPTAEGTIYGKQFVGWLSDEIVGTTNEASPLTTATMGNADVTYYAVYANVTPGTSEEVTDVLTREITGVTGTSYTEWSEKTAKSNAVYAGQSAGGNESIQLRSKDSNSGVITTASGGKLKKVVVVWNNGTESGRTLDVYGSNTAYKSAADLYAANTQGTKLGSIVYDGTSTELTITGDYAFIGLRSNNGALYLDNITITWESGTPASYSDYCTTVESEEPVVEPSVPAPITAGYYRIKNVGNGKYVNVAGRKTVTFVDNDATATAAGTVLKVESNDKGQVQVLRSQAIDLPGYADKAMKYVPEVVQLVVNKLHAEGSGAILGENGLDKIMEKFDASFDYHLYTEQAEGGIRIYGKTPSMRPVVEFYNENKDNVDAKLPMLEDFINDAINKILDKTGGRGKSILVPFSLHDVWKNMGSSLTEPKNDATKLTFLQEVLSNEQNVWDFAYQTAMIYWGKVKEHPRYDEFKGKLGDYAKYIDKIEYIRPNVKYYLATDGSNLDVLSQDNELVKNGDVALWSLEERRDFKVTFNEENVLNDKYYTTLYTDFAYDLPEDGSVKAYKVTEVNPTTGVAVKVALESVPAQTPVLLESESAGAKTLTLNTDEGTAPTDNILVGADAIINEYDINESQVVSLFEFALEVLGESTYNEYLAKYEHLMDRNSGTVNNKFFFGLTTKELGEGADEEGLISARSLAMKDNLLGFYENWDVSANHAFLLNKDYDPVKLFLKGDIDRDGDVDNDDLKALIKIILGTDTEEDNYDYDAAHVNDDEDIDIADVTALVNILNTLQTQTNN